MAPVRPPVPSASAPAPAPYPHVVAITSGKGGVGKSSIAVNLGLALAKTGRRVCILDADTGLANVNILLGMHPKLGLEHVLFGANTIEEVMLEAPHGLRVIPGASGISECVTLHPRQQMRLTRELARIEADLDVLLLDTAAGIADTTLDFVAAAHQVLLVITPEPTSLTDAFSMLKLLDRRRRLSYQVVVNMAGTAGEARNVFHRFSAAVEKYIGLRVHLLGFLLRDESLRSAVTLQHPVALFPESDPSCRSFTRLAEGLEAVLAEAPPPVSFSQYWQQRFHQPLQAQEPIEEAAEPVPAHVAGSQRPEAVLSMEAAAPAAAGLPAAPEDNGRERLNALLRAADGEQRGAEWLRQLHDAYWQAVGAPALDVLQLVARLQRDRDHDALLERLRRQLGAAPEPVIAPSVARPEAVVAPSHPRREDVPARPSRDSAPTPVAPGRAHGYDAERFGSQQQLLELLQRQGAGQVAVVDLVRALSAGG